MAEPTRAQLEILQVLWKHGPSTVRLVNEQLNQQQKQSLSYTSTLKLMQIMHEKGLVHRDESNMTHVYSALLEEQKTKGIVLKKFVDAMYSGSAKNLMLELLGNEKMNQRVMSAYVELFKKEGYGKVSLEQVVELREHGVSPDFINGLHEAGYARVLLDKALEARDHGVTVEFIRRMQEKGLKNLSLDEYVRLRDSGM